jgi:predicted AAA+ superfamily ATPase
MIENPFVLRGYVSDEYFCDREKETADLTNEIKNGNNVTLIAPRRIGKTGLIQHVYAKKLSNGRLSIRFMTASMVLHGICKECSTKFTLSPNRQPMN